MLGVERIDKCRRRSRRTPRGGRPRRRASGTRPRRARPAGSPPPTALARATSARAPCSSSGGSGDGGSNVDPTARGSRAGTPPGRPRAGRPQLRAPAPNSSAAGLPRATPRARRLDHRQRRDALRALGAREQRDDAAVGVAHEVVAGLAARRDPDGASARSRPLDRRVPAETPAARGPRSSNSSPSSRTLRAPRHRAARDAAVDEDETWACIRHVTKSGRFWLTDAEFRCYKPVVGFRSGWPPTLRARRILSQPRPVCCSARSSS